MKLEHYFTCFESLVKELEPWRQQKIVFTNGCFDLLHIGHVRCLQEAKALGDCLVVGLDTDESVKLLKGPSRPLQPQDNRAEILLALSCVDYVCLFGEGNPLPLIQAVKPDILVKGGDWPLEKIVGADFVLNNGGEVKSLSFVSGHSTTKIVEKFGQKQTK